LPWTSLSGGSDEDFERCGVAQEGRGARGEPVGARLEEHDEVTDVGTWQRDAVAEQVERRAEAANDAVSSAGSSARLPTMMG
jgi:hypothetical protein